MSTAPRLPGLATWRRYPRLAERIVDQTPPRLLVQLIATMLQLAHETGAAAMRDRCVKAIRGMVGRRFHSRQTLAMACVEALRALPAESGRPPQRHQIAGKRRQFLRQPKTDGKRPELAGLTRSELGKRMAAINNAKRSAERGNQQG